MARILLIDDDKELIESVTEILKEEGHSVISAHDGAGGCKLANRENPDLILLDVMMKTDNEGFEVARQLKEGEKTKAIPVILITGIKKAKGLPFSFEPDEDWLPVKAVLDKPVAPDRLIKSVNDALGE